MDYLEIVDRIVLEAYEKGFAKIPTEAWNDVRVRNKLKMYGHENAVGQYFLNQLGVSYAMQGCSKGIMEQMDIEKRIQSLELKMKLFSAEKQELSFWVSIFSAIISTIVAIITFLL